MSYHDSYRSDMEGIAVVNPLIRIEQQLAKIRKLLEEEEKIKDLSAIDLKNLIEKILNGGANENHS